MSVMCLRGYSLWIFRTMTGALFITPGPNPDNKHVKVPRSKGGKELLLEPSPADLMGVRKAT